MRLKNQREPIYFGACERDGAPQQTPVAEWEASNTVAAAKTRVVVAVFPGEIFSFFLS